MSYILDALEKVERERNLGEVPRLHSFDNYEPIPKRRRVVWPWVLTAALLANVALAAYMINARDDARATMPDDQQEVTDRSAPDRPAARVLETDVEASAGVSDSGISGPAARDEPDGADAMRSTAEETSTRPERARAATRTVAVGSQAPPAATGTPPAATGTPPASTGTQPSAPFKLTTSTTTSQKTPAKRAVATAEEPPLLLDMPPEFRRALPPLHIDVHMHDGNKVKRFVLINSRRYREGDRLDEGPRLDSITRDGVILSHNGRRFVMLVQN